jgi:outer membrane receptor protein involved in Fe transport/outer membrane protein OmpA-like peptidoglycan-associated protein
MKLQHRNRILLNSVSTLVLTFSAAVVGAPAAHAQQVATASADNGGIEEIVVTTRKRTERLQDVPDTVTAITADQIQQYGIKNLADVAALTPGLTYDEGISRLDTRPAIRGLYVQRGRPSVAILVDGFDVTSESIVSAGGGSLMNQSLLDIERIEVVEGPQSVLYGRSAFGGAVNYVTKRPTEDFTGEMNFDYGNYNTYKVFGEFSGPIVQDKLLFGVSAEGDGNDGYYKNNYNGQTLNGTSDKGISAQLEAKPTDNLDIRLHGEASSQKEGQRAAVDTLYSSTQKNYCLACSAALTLPIVTGNQTASANQVAYSGNYPGLRTDTYRGTLSVDYDLDWATVTALTGVLQNREKLTQDTDYEAYPRPPAFFAYENELQNLYEDTSQYSQEFRIASSKDSKLKWLGGFLYYYEDAKVIDSTQYYLDHFSAASPHAQLQPIYNNAILAPTTLNRRTNHESFFGSVGYEVLPGLDVTAEVRLAKETVDVTKPFQSRSTISTYAAGVTYGPGGVPLGIYNIGASLDTYYANPRVSIEYHIDPDDMVYFTWSKGTKPGGFSLLNISNSTYLSQSFKPEKLYAYEIGLKTDWLDHKLRIDGDMYFNDYHDQQVSYSNTFVFPVVSGVTNIGTVYNIGEELNVTYKPIPELTLSVSYSHVDEYIETYVSNVASDQEYLPGGNFQNKQLPSVPEHTASIVARYERPITDDFSGFAQVTTMIQSDRYGNTYNTWKFGGFIQPDITLGLENDTWSALFYMNNVFNDMTARSAISYLDLHQDFHPTALLYLPDPRTFGIRTSYKFGGGSEAPATTAAYTPPPVVAPKPASTARSYQVFFDFNKSDLTPQAVTIVDTAAKNAGPAKVTEIEVTGHTDTVGSDAYNMRLSRRRAESVAAELEKMGIPSSEIAIFAKGKKDLLVPTADGVKEPQNRRVQIVYAGGPAS